MRALMPGWSGVFATLQEECPSPTSFWAAFACLRPVLSWPRRSAVLANGRLSYLKPFRRGIAGPSRVIMEFFRMADLRPLTPEILVHISQTLQVPMKGLVASVGLLDEGGTVPF